MSASEDFSVRLWLINGTENGAKYIQLVHYLDVNQWNSEQLCIDFDLPVNMLPRRILSLDVNQNLRLWPLGSKAELVDHLKSTLEVAAQIDEN